MDVVIYRPDLPVSRKGLIPPSAGSAARCVAQMSALSGNYLCSN